MNGLLLLALSLAPAGDAFPYAEAEAELSEDIGVHELKAHVYRLASPEFLGRRGAGAARAARPLEAAFQRLKLQPAFDGAGGVSPLLMAPASSAATWRQSCPAPIRT